MLPRAACLLLIASTLIAPCVHGQPGTTEGSASALPTLDPRSDHPIDLIFTEPTSVREIYRAIGKAWGINVVFDPRLRDREMAIVLSGVTPHQGFANVVNSAGHFYIVLDQHTILIADDTPQNRRNYEHQVIQSFYLENTEVADMMTLVRALIAAKHIAVDEQRNVILMRDTADTVKVAQEIVARNDRPRAEVMIDVDLLTIDGRRLRKLALQPVADGPRGEDGVPPRLATGQIDLIRAQDSVEVLAQPRLAVLDGARGKLRLVDRLPLPTRLADAGSGEENPGTSSLYRDVGLDIQIVPRVHSAQEVSLELRVGFDTLIDWVKGQDGPPRPLFGGVEVEASLRLRDGETYLMSGLMTTLEDAEPAPSGFPSGRFLRPPGDPQELILAFTPHILRGPDPLAADAGPLWIGTEASVSREGRERVASPGPGPFDPPPEPRADATGAPDDDAEARRAVRERLQERLRAMPRADAPEGYSG